MSFILSSLVGVAFAAWPPEAKPFATATLSPKSGSSVHGTVDFARAPGKLLVRVAGSGLSAGPHGFHIHEKGDCSAADASSAGAHYNPGAVPHGGPKSAVHHGGDLGNLTGDELRRGVELTVPAGTIDWKDIVGRSVILHEKADDLKTDPSGNSGGRVACALIQATPGVASE